MGDPAGIGAEVTAKALLDGRVYRQCRPFVVGSTAAMDAALKLIGSPVPPTWPTLWQMWPARRERSMC